MIFHETPLDGAFVVEPERRVDERGFFARTFCMDEFASRGLQVELVQENVSYSARRGTLRGMHFQRAPHGETKVVRCTRGAIFDVIVDIREGSTTRGRWISRELSEDNRLAFYVPIGFAHGFLTLTNDTEVLYLMGKRYVPAAASGYRYDDPAFSIAWPFAPIVIAAKDLSFPPVGP